jgi:transcriptional regulator with PAS, ATPase and Fis domain
MVVGQSELMQELRERVLRIAATNFTVLIEGESGTGKELVAREIHANSHRRRGPLVAVNCAALVETLVEAELFGIEERTATGVRGRRGKFELASGGTLFLDEVADLSLTAQAKLLRVLQDMSVERVGADRASPINTRVIAATNRSLAARVSSGQFRADLFYRLAGVEVFVPPLRARREDIPLLIEYFLAKHTRASSWSVSSSAEEALVTYDWPGNVRQLARVIERAVALSPSSRITVDDLPAEVSKVYMTAVREEPDHDLTLRAWASRYVRLVLDRNEGNKRRTCEALDITYHTLQSHLQYTSSSRRRTARAAGTEPSATAERPLAS